MSYSEQHLAQQLDSLRRHFDEAFSLPIATATASQVNVLSIGIRSRQFAIALPELRGVHPRPKITTIPSLAPEMIGLAGIRGNLVPVYDLGALLGLPARSDSPWIALAQAASVGFAFDELQGHQALDSVIYQHATLDATGLLRIPEQDASGRPIVNIPALVEIIVRRSGLRTVSEDHTK